MRRCFPLFDCISMTGFTRGKPQGYICRRRPVPGRSTVKSGDIVIILCDHRLYLGIVRDVVSQWNQLVVPGIAEDRISDTASSIIKNFFIEFTATQAEKWGIPTRPFRLGNIFNFSKHSWVPANQSNLPYNPKDNSPILLVPLDLLRHLPWINYHDYYRTSFAPHVLPPDQRRKRVSKAAVLAYNARNYVEIERYVETKEKTANQCHPDSLFKPLSSSTLQSKAKSIRELNTGAIGGADRKFEDLITDLFSSLFIVVLNNHNL